MSILDKITGRAKKAAGDLAGDSSLRREGTREEKKGEAKDKLADAQDSVEERAGEVSDLERKT
ncbi:MAG: CsbD family protein [Thermoleophilaceae bacterium]|nr:CsbD family protein [Thermoleophilaceae bacterium]